MPTILSVPREVNNSDYVSEVMTALRNHAFDTGYSTGDKVQQAVDGKYYSGLMNYQIKLLNHHWSRVSSDKRQKMVDYTKALAVVNDSDDIF